MTNNSFTLGYAHALRDATLSLSGKGLYLVLSSFIGMPGWVLTKAALEPYCESRYALEKAWRELLDRGYLKHYCMIDSRGAFVHSYELMQEPSGTPARMTYVAGMDRENGDLRMVLSSEKKRDFVRVPNALLRSQTLPLAVKGLFSVVAHLAGIPNFSLNPDGIRSFCKEKAKHFATLWRALKLFGLLKQHRHPAGMDCHFSYEYELLDTPDYGCTVPRQPPRRRFGIVLAHDRGLHLQCGFAPQIMAFRCQAGKEPSEEHRPQGRRTSGTSRTYGQACR